MKESRVARDRKIPSSEDMDEYYHDDPEIESPHSRRFLTRPIVAGLALIFGGALFFQTTLAANINIGNSSVQFGQGITQVVACTTGSSLTVTPRASFINQSGSGSFYFSSFTVSNIPVGCDKESFTLRAYGPSSSTPLAIFDTSVASAVIYDNAGTYQSSSGSTLSVTTNSSSSFTATFTNPVALGSSVAKITLESSNGSAPFDYNSIVFNPSSYLMISPGIAPGSGPFTIETWLKTASSIHGGDIIGNANSSNSLSFILDNANLLHIDGYGVTAYNYTTATSLQPNTWYHIAISRDASNKETVWVNGVRSSTGVQTDSINYSTYATGINWAYCTWCVAGNSTFNGERITNLRVVIGTALYDPNSANITVPTLPLSVVPNTKLLLLFNDASSITTDSSGNQTITNNGTTFVSGQ